MAKILTPPGPSSIESLNTRHDRRNFSCSIEALDTYLKRYARQHAAANISRTYVAVAGATIYGFYTLAMSGIRKENLPAKYSKRFPNLPLPVARLARLAVDLRYQGRGLGELRLADALHRCKTISQAIGMLGVLVDAKDDRAREWYERYEFAPLPDSPLTFWLPTSAILAI